MTIAKEQLKSIIERIEAQEAGKAEITEFIKGIYLEAKSNGYDTKALKKIVALRKMDEDERNELDALMDLYLTALGMLPDAEAD